MVCLYDVSYFLPALSSPSRTGVDVTDYVVVAIEYLQCLPPLRPHTLCPRHSRLDRVCAREQKPGDLDER